VRHYRRRTPINLKPQERELVENTLEDLRHIAKEAGPNADDHQLRRVSVQLRQLLVDDYLIRSWRLLQLEPKAPTIIAPRLRPEQYGSEDFAVAGGGMVGGLAVGALHIMPGKAISPEEVKAIVEQGRGDIEFPFRLADFMQSCAVYVKGRKVSRKQLVQYVANKKGGAHLDGSRKNDEEAYSALDNVTDAVQVKGDEKLSPKNTIYLALLSIGQNLTQSPDIQRFMEAAEAALASK
jgi:hypothetical protein